MKPTVHYCIDCTVPLTNRDRRAKRCHECAAFVEAKRKLSRKALRRLKEQERNA